MEDIQQIKQRFGILGNDPQLNRSISIARQVAITDMSVLIVGESGVGKEVFSKIIHTCSPRKHEKYIAVNCGAIPQGTIESELFGHIKGAFTNADRDRKGYFAEADKGTIFLDEVGELPMNMQVKLLRVLEYGEYIPVGSSKALRCDVRVVSATNVNLIQAIGKGQFREDLYYRLNQINIQIPPLRERKDDIYMLFKRFAVDQAEKYNMPHISLTTTAKQYLKIYPWKGNIRQLKNIAEQISIIEQDRDIDEKTLEKYIPLENTLPCVIDNSNSSNANAQLEQIVIENQKAISILQTDLTQLKNVVATIVKQMSQSSPYLLNRATNNVPSTILNNDNDIIDINDIGFSDQTNCTDSKDIDLANKKDNDILTLEQLEKKAIIQALQRHNGKRALAAKELGISERTLYRKINDYDIVN